MEKSKNSNQSIARESNIELLRIIAMILIVASHFSVHGDFTFSPESVTLNRFWIEFIGFGGKIGVNIFVLISGYFLIASSERKTNKLLKLWIQVVSYSIVCFSVTFIMKTHTIGFKEIINNMLPITFKQMWFASTYFVLYLISPYISIFLKNLSKRDYQHMLILLTICWCIIPTFLKENFESNSLIWFIYLYMIAAYIRLYIPKNKINCKKYITTSLILVLLSCLFIIICDILGVKIQFFSTKVTYIYSMQRLPVVLISICMFLGFLKIDIGYKKIINTIASTTFGIYLIHDNPYIREVLWKLIFKNTIYADKLILIPYSILVIVIVFVSCAIIEWIRIHTFEKHYMNIVNKIANFIDKIVEKFFQIKIFER